MCEHSGVSLVFVILYFVITVNSYTKRLKRHKYIHPTLKIKDNGVRQGLLDMLLLHWKGKPFIFLLSITYIYIYIYIYMYNT